MRTLITLILLLLSSCIKRPIDRQQIIFNRIDYIFNLKSSIGSDIWPNFDKGQFDVPLIYFTNSSSYVTNPTEYFLKTYKPQLAFQSNMIKVYKTKERIDNQLFHMSTNINTGDSSAYNYNSPFMLCSSLEETRKVIEDVNSTELWVTMVIHEYFHGFQFKHKPYLDLLSKNAIILPADSLRNIYKYNSWFKEKIDKENEILLLVLSSENRNEINNMLDIFIAIREQRRKETKQKLGLDIENYEKMYETLEGTARYVEQKLYEKFSTKQPDYKLIRSDTSYQSYSYFKNYKIEKEEWLFKTEKTSYYYATGFNMARLLDKLDIEYKNKLFHEGNITLEDIVKDINK
jgi:hypothetical protein